MTSISRFEPNHAKRDVLLYIDSHLYAAAKQHDSCFIKEDTAFLRPSDEVGTLQSLLDRYIQRSTAGEQVAPLLPLQRRFEVAAQTTPCARAVSYQGRWLTYGELDAQADALALHLQSIGLQAGAFCLVDLAPSIAQIRSALAVLKAGAACLYLDPDIGASNRALAFALIRPALRIVRGDACAYDADLRTISCNEDAAPLPFGWPDERPIHSHTPASAHVVTSANGDLQLHVRTHACLSANLEPTPAQPHPRAQQSDPDMMWRPLSRGAPYKLSN